MTKQLFGILVLSLLPTSLFANLMVYPTRVNLNDKERTASVAVRNRSSTKMTYQIKLVYYKMNVDGSVEMVDDAAAQPQSAYKHVRFSPRTVTLEPNGEQVIRIIANQVSQLPEGDYRIHLFFEPEEANETVALPTKPADGKLSFQLQAKVALAVPVIFTKGTPQAAVKLSNLKLKLLKDKTPAFEADMITEGNAFPFGDFYLYFLAEGKTEPVEIGVFRGISSYVPARQLIYPLNKDLLKLERGMLKLEYRNSLEKEGNSNTVLSQTSAFFAGSLAP